MLGEPGNQANIEYFFRLLYEWLFGQHGAVDFSLIKAFLANLWVWITGIGYVLSIIGLFLIVYITMRLFELRKREEEYYSTLIVAPESAGTSPRWEHIQSLLGSTSISEWKEAILEADVMLDDMLARQGYMGEGVGEKLRTADQEKFHTLQDAWEAHKIRNQIAHEGSAFQLSESLARRTVARYESVFREFNEI